MSDTNRSAKAIASLSAGMAAIFVPQFSQATLVTVGGDGGTGSVTLNNGDMTSLGGILARSLQADNAVFTSLGADGSLLDPAAGPGRQRLFSAVRSSIATMGVVSGSEWQFVAGNAAYPYYAPGEGALWGSDDNWVPGHFSVSGINSGNPIYGWLHVQLDGFGTFLPPGQVTILSFTYDDAATDTTAFTKPVGGFTIGGGTVPEPPTLGLAALALGAAGVVRRRHRMAQTADA